jgi:competence protein ComEC
MIESLVIDGIDLQMIAQNQWVNVISKRFRLTKCGTAEDDFDASHVENRRFMPLSSAALIRRLASFSGKFRLSILSVVFFLAASPSFAQPEQKALRAFFVDVEGGQATLFVTPAGESLLIDTGWPGNDGRDADRIAGIVKKVGIQKIDYVLLTHFHIDHAGGFPQLVARIPVGEVFDHGDNRETTDAQTVEVWKAYQEVLAREKLKRVTLKPGDNLPIRGMRVTVLSSDGAVIDHPLPGAGQENNACQSAEKYRADQTENARSLGTIITFGNLRILDLGDLTQDKERELVCPKNKIGTVDILVVSHHGSDSSNSSVLLNAISPRVAIMDNGAKKGGAPSAWTNIENIPHLENLWQLHFAEAGGPEHNVAPEFIANLEGPDNANYLELTAWPHGNFEVYNSRTQKSKKYAAR